MGTGIAAAIPLIWEPYKRWGVEGVEKNDFSPAFFDNYDIDETGDIYTIKHEVLLNNYKSFFVEFYDWIGEPTDADLPKAESLQDFCDVFNIKARNGRNVPFFDKHGSYFSMLGGLCQEHWMFYFGSYKALVEVYSTFLHFERILARAMENPLAGAVKFGLFG